MFMIFSEVMLFVFVTKIDSQTFKSQQGWFMYHSMVNSINNRLDFPIRLKFRFEFESTCKIYRIQPHTIGIIQEPYLI